MTVQFSWDNGKLAIVRDNDNVWLEAKLNGQVVKVLPTGLDAIANEVSRVAMDEVVVQWSHPIHHDIIKYMFLVSNDKLLKIKPNPCPQLAAFDVTYWDGSDFVDFDEFDTREWGEAFTSENRLSQEFEHRRDDVKGFLYPSMRQRTHSCDSCHYTSPNMHYVDDPELERVYSRTGEVLEHVCNGCYEHGTVHCEECGHLHLYDHVFTVRYDSARHVMCQQCINDVFGNMDVVACPECGVYVPRDHYNDRFDCCDVCADQVMVDRLIHSYNYKPRPLFTDALDDRRLCDPKPGVRYVGLEMEVDCGDRDKYIVECWKAAKDKGYADMFYFMFDGSLRDEDGNDTGIEVTTVPLALNYALDGFPFEFFKEQANLYGMRAHNTKTCGLHIHVNKDSIPEFQSTMAKILLVFDKFYMELCQFGRRISKEQAERWADRPRANIFKEDNFRAIDAKLNRAGYSHYKAVNLSPSETVEFRLWKGTTNPGTIRATIDFVSAMLDMCAASPLETVYDMVWSDFVRAILPHLKRKKTIDYMAKRKLMEEF